MKPGSGSCKARDAPNSNRADVVSRAVWAHMQAGHSIFLDATKAMGTRFTQRFPGIAASCRAAGFDPATTPIPVRPAAHYHMGGIAVDAEGRSTLPGLWACGEAASTGLHGANRLASNSLLEAAVTGTLVAQSVAGTAAGHAAPLAAVEQPTAHAPETVRRIFVSACRRAARRKRAYPGHRRPLKPRQRTEAEAGPPSRS